MCYVVISLNRDLEGIVMTETMGVAIGIGNIREHMSKSEVLPGTPPVFDMNSRRFIRRNITSYLFYGVLTACSKAQPVFQEGFP